MSHNLFKRSIAEIAEKELPQDTAGNSRAQTVTAQSRFYSVSDRRLILDL